jgi:hypothetical protein
VEMTFVDGLQSLEVACDESGYEGEKMIGTTTDVFAHASLRLGTAEAEAALLELRRRIRSPATQYKANHILRSKHRRVLEWFLSPESPVHGQANVYLIDKTYFVLSNLLRLLAPQAGVAPLYRAVRAGPGWEDFLIAANNLMRSKEFPDSVAEFFGAAEAKKDELGELFGESRPLAEALRAALRDDPELVPPMEPLVPAIVSAVSYWGSGGQPVAIVHDRQKTLPVERIAQIRRLLPAGDELAGFSFANAGLDARIQIADVLGGAVRQVASDALNGNADPLLTGFLRSYVDGNSVWGDARSWPG